jgi:AraC family transcriptional regulator, regulatory protein of adaptative response / DNA-3-methyladenine glycosylase II
MSLDAEVCFRALAAHDARHDGIFFVGVASTGIYCRPVCPAKAPKRENCKFYETAAAAEQAGFRPCLRCRPEIAPGRAHVDRIAAWARRAIKRIEGGALNDMSVDDLAASLGVSGRQLRRAVHERYGVSPVQLAQTHRLLSAKRLLTDTRLPIGEVAMVSGFSSLRRFNACFQERYGSAPNTLRKRGQIANSAGELTCELGYRPPFSLPHLMNFLTPRALAGVESVSEGVFSRTVRSSDATGWLRVSAHPTRSALVVRLSESLAPKLPWALDRVRRLFDLGAEPHAIQAVLGSLCEGNPGVRVPGAFDGFETAVRAILGQQVTVRFAAQLAGRFAAAFGESVETPFPELTRVFPTPAEIASLTLEKVAELGIIRSRARAILALAEAVSGGGLVLDPSADPEATRCALRKIAGIGDWTADYIAMRCLSWPDAFPAGDLGVLKALDVSNPKQAAVIAEQWRPWRAYAVMRLWQGACLSPHSQP